MLYHHKFFMYAVQWFVGSAGGVSGGRWVIHPEWSQKVLRHSVLHKWQEWEEIQGWGYGGVNPFFTAASMLGNTKISPLTAKQTSFRKDVTIWLEASTTSAAYLITDDKRFIQTFENPHMMRLFEVCCERALHIKPMALISATEYLGLPTEKS